MGTRYAVVKGVASTDLVTVQTAITSRSGTFLKYDTVGLNVDAEFPTDALGVLFASDISGISTDIDWDVYPHFRNIGQMH